MNYMIHINRSYNSLQRLIASVIFIGIPAQYLHLKEKIGLNLFSPSPNEVLILLQDNTDHNNLQ